ncbi:MAG: protein BatD [Saprospiraceae bacterium]|nr:protein BatD [Saprospiraceae bacterium]
MLSKRLRNNTHYVRFWMITVAVLLPLLLSAQVVFEATTNVKVVALDETFEIVFNINQGNGREFSPPSFKEFDVMNGPNQSMSTTIINGKLSQRLAYAYLLHPKKVGKFTIDAATIFVKGTRYQTKPVSIEVRPSDKQDLKGDLPKDKTAFVQLELDKTSAFLGEQVMLDYVLYTTVDVHNAEMLKPLSFDGFFAKEMQNFDMRSDRVTQNGTTYVTKLLKRVALFPQQVGSLTIPPANLQLTVATEERSLFYSSNMYDMPVTTNSATIQVKPLPINAPANFMGGAGSNFVVNLSADKTQLTTDDVLTLRVEVLGDGDPKRIQLPPLPLAADDFEVYKPHTVEENFLEGGSGQLSSMKRIEYQILPKREGIFTLHPTFSYFNTTQQRFESNNTQPITLSVTKGSGRHTNIAPTTPTTKKELSWIYLIAVIGALAAAAGYWNKRQNPPQKIEDAATKKKKYALTIAQQRLSKAKFFWKENKATDFYTEITRSLLGYVCDKHNLQLGTTTREEVRTILQTAVQDEALVNIFFDCVHTADLALFGGQDNTDTMQQTYQNAVQTIVEIEQRWK